MLHGDIFGLPIPEAGPVFAIALAVHIAAGLTAVAAGALAATARKRPGRHPKAGRVYLIALATIFATATVMAVIRWREDAHLFRDRLYCLRARSVRVACPATASAGVAGATRHRHGRLLHRPTYRVLRGQRPVSTAVEPATAPDVWLLPSVVGIPLIWWALHRFHRAAS
jgi:hypothetical protein